MSDDERDRIDVKSTSFQRLWQPRLIELTQLPHPDLCDGQATKLFVDPSKVVVICRTYVRNELMNGTKDTATECTAVGIYGGVPSHVLEAPEEVAHRIRVAMKEAL